MTVRIWDIAGTDQVLKLATRPLGGRVNDLSWDGESKRIIAVGDGRERFGAAFLADSGSSCGEIQGHSKVSFFPLFRCAVGSVISLIGGTGHQRSQYKASATV